MTQPPQNGFGAAQPYPQHQPYGYPVQQPHGAAAYPSQPHGYGYPLQAPTSGAGYNYGPAGSVFRYAAWWQRAIAGLVDLVITAGPIYGAVGLGWVITGGDSGQNFVLGNVVTLIGLIATIAGVIWEFRLEGRTGQSIGKRALSIRLVREATGELIGTGAAVGRRLTHVLDNALFGLGWLWPLWDAKKQTIADKVHGTVVVKLGE